MCGYVTEPLISECGVFCLQARIQRYSIFRPFHAVLLYTAVVIAIVVRNELLCFFVQGKEHFGVAHGIAVLLSVMSQRKKSRTCRCDRLVQGRRAYKYRPSCRFWLFAKPTMRGKSPPPFCQVFSYYKTVLHLTMGRGL